MDIGTKTRALDGLAASTLAVLLTVASLVQQAYPYPCASSMAPNQETANTILSNSYNDWKTRYLTSDGAGGFLRVRRPEDGNDTVSEGIAYGMILAVYHDDRPTFDSLWGYAQSHFGHNQNGLMPWHLNAGNTLYSPNDSNSASDADQDMAFALIAADKRWGGYAAAATSLINKIITHDVESGTFVLKPGDGWGGANDPHPIVNPSYFAPAFYKVFKAYTQDTRWDQVVAKCYEIIGSINSSSGAGSTGLLPNWATPSGTPLDSAYYSFQNSYDYTYDACRVPWRLAHDAAWYCDQRAINQLAKLNAFFKGVGPANIKDGYRLDGSLIGSFHNAAFIGPAASGAIVDGDAAYKAAMWNETVSRPFENYYNDSLRLLSLLWMSGKMTNPMEVSSLPGKLVLDDFESGNTNKWISFSDGGSTMNRSINSPGAVGNNAMRVDYSIVSWAGVSQGFTAPQNWAGYNTFDFWLEGGGSGNTIRLEVSDNRAAGSSTDTSERFEYKIVDDWTGWRKFSIALASFQRRPDWQPTGAPNDGLTLSQVWGFNLSPISGAGRFHLDQVELVTRTYSVLDDFEGGNTDKWVSFNGPGSTINRYIVSPGARGGTAMRVDYGVASWAGVSQGYPVPQDWSAYQAFEFWYYGGNSGNTIRLEVSDNRAPGSAIDTSERFEYKFSDTFSGWRYLSVPWGSFARRADWQPAGAPNDGLTLTQVWGFNFSPISGGGFFQLDQVQLMK